MTPTPYLTAEQSAELLGPYVALRRAGVSHRRAIEQAGLTEAQLRKALRRDLPLALELFQLWGSRRRHPVTTLYLLAALILTTHERAELAELAERWRRP